VWHLEVEDLLVLKNNKGTEDNRVRHMDYGVQFNKVMYERLLSGGDITLFSPHDVPEMFDAFYTDVDRFRELYETAERNTKLRKKKVKAIDLFTAFMQERKDTGRVYLQNVDHANNHGSFKPELAPIRQSNLCCEIDLPTKPIRLTVQTIVTSIVTSHRLKLFNRRAGIAHISRHLNKISPTLATSTSQLAS
jgi:ribonucleoside-diphosphate reductase alpha chain